MSEQERKVIWAEIEAPLGVLMEVRGDGEDGSILITDAIKLLQDALSKVPEDHRDEAYLTIRCYGDYASAHIKAGWSREETDEEYATRRAAEDSAEKTYQQTEEARQRQVYLALKDKFEPKEN